MLSNITLYALGDISFRGRYEDKASSLVFKSVSSCFEEADLVIANLESPLVGAEVYPVPRKCTLRGSAKWATVLKKSGIDLVSLANNHIMDYGDDGLLTTMAALDEAGISYVGAGRNRQIACLPVFREIAGREIAFFARSAVEVSSLCDADKEQPGVASLHEDELVSSIRQCRANVNLVVVMLHWGIEHYHYPTPQQRILANRLVSAGADILLGNHPHVLQGEEKIGKSVVSYSSGNFLFDEFFWSMATAEGLEPVTLLASLTKKNRQGMILEICQSTDGKISTRQHFTQISDDPLVEPDHSPARQKEYQRFCSRLHLPWYDFFWKLYSIKREWDLRLSTQLSPGHVVRNLYKIRPRHFQEMLIKMRRSAKVSSGKSTNPYEG